MSSPATGSGLFKFLRPRLRPQPEDFVAAATWGIAGFTGALWFIQPFDWLKKQFFQESEKNAV